MQIFLQYTNSKDSEENIFLEFVSYNCAFKFEIFRKFYRSSRSSQSLKILTPEPLTLSLRTTT